MLYLLAGGAGEGADEEARGVPAPGGQHGDNRAQVGGTVMNSGVDLYILCSDLTKFACRFRFSKRYSSMRFF